MAGSLPDVDESASADEVGLVAGVSGDVLRTPWFA